MRKASLLLAFDCVVLSIVDNKLRVAVAQRRARNELNERDPFPGALSLPGGLVREDEAIAETIKRRLVPEVGLDMNLAHFGVFDAPDRDPRLRVVSVAYLVLLPPEKVPHVTWGSAYQNGSWAPVDCIPKSGWAFDHREIVVAALRDLQNKARREPTGFELLPKQFDLPTVHRLQEQLRQEKIDIRNLRRNLLKFGLIRETGSDASGPGLPKKLYGLDRNVLNRLKELGYHAA